MCQKPYKPSLTMQLILAGIDTNTGKLPFHCAGVGLVYGAADEADDFRRGEVLPKSLGDGLRLFPPGKTANSQINAAGQILQAVREKGVKKASEMHSKPHE